MIPEPVRQVVPEPKLAVIVDANGKRVRSIPLPEIDSFLAVAKLGHGAQLISFEVWGDRVTALDTQGQQRWSFRGLGVDWAAPVDIGRKDGDAIAIGYNGDTGVVLLDANGKPIWNVHGPGNVWSVSGARLKRGGSASVICPDENKIVAFDAAGHKCREFRPADADAVFGGDIDGDGIDEVFGLGTSEVSGEWLWCFNADGTLRWKVSARNPSMRCDRPMSIGRLIPGGSQVVVANSDGAIYVYGSDGKALPGLRITPNLVSVCILSRSDKPTDALVAVSSESVELYEWRPDMIARQVLLPPPPETRRLESDPLAEAVYRNDLKRVVELLNRGANPNARSRQGSPVLLVAISRGYCDLARLLIDKGANSNVGGVGGESPLIAASNDSRITRLLLDHGADPNFIGRTNDLRAKGFTPLMAAAMEGNFKVVQLLVERGASVNAADDNMGETALTWALNSKKLEIAQFLIEHGADVNHRDWQGGTPLHTAAMQGSAPIVKLLLDHGADPNSRSDLRRMLFWGAGFVGDRQAEKRMERDGVLTERREDGESPLDRTADPEVIALLKAHGARSFKREVAEATVRYSRELGYGNNKSKRKNPR